MKNSNKTNEQLLAEIKQLKANVVNLEQTEIQLEQTLEKLKESEEKFKFIAESLQEGLWITDKYDKMIYFNKSMEGISDAASKDVLGMNVLNDLPKETIEHFKNFYKKAKETLKPTQFEAEVVTPAGKKSIQSGWLIPSNKAEKFDGMVCTINDITERKYFENELKESENRLRLSMNAAMAGFWHWNIETGEVIWDDRMQEIFGFEVGTYDGKYETWKKSVHPDDVEEADRQTNEALKNGTDYDFEYRLNLKTEEGIWRTVRAQAIVVSNDKGIRLRMAGICEDITERKRAEEELMRNQYYLSKAQEIGRIGTWELDLIKNELIWTEQNYLNFGVQIGTPITYEIFLDCVHPDDRDYVNSEWLAAVDGNPYDIQHRVIANSEVRWVREKADLEYDSKGKPIKAIGFTQDITERKQAEDAIKESEEKYRALYDNAPLSYQSLNEDGYFKDVNPTWLNTLGYKKEEVIGYNYADFLHPDWKPHFQKNFPAFKERGYVHDVHFKIRHKDGHYLDISFEGCIGYKPDGSFKQTYCVFQDISQRKQAEEKLKANIKQLQMTNDIMIDRELTLNDTRKEVNNLLTELGRERKYKIVL